MNLRIPGPIPVPEDILEDMSRPMINHRGPEYKDLLLGTTERLKRVFETDGDVWIITGSGTAAMEAAVVNTLSPGDKVINATIGVSSETGSRTSRAPTGQRSIRLSSRSARRLTSTCCEVGARRRIRTSRRSRSRTTRPRRELRTTYEAVASVVKGEFDKLLIVDGISSVASIPISTDAWELDVVATASQKGWMLPPGLAFMSFSERAWEAHAESTMPKFYLDMAQYKKYYEIGQPPYTPIGVGHVRPGQRTRPTAQRRLGFGVRTSRSHRAVHEGRSAQSRSRVVRQG